jgi:hypothetical protein
MSGVPYMLGGMSLMDGRSQTCCRLVELLDERPPRTRILTINAWNEWTEGSYLEPDTINGMGYLEAIRDVFGVR